MTIPQPTEPEFALNLCDVVSPDALAEGGRALLRAVCDQACARSGHARIDRLYLGSYFCERHFLHLHDRAWDVMAEFAREHGLPLTLVLPEFGQGTLHEGTRRIEGLLGRGLFDELTVNDYGMASRFAPACRQAGMRLCWGRLFMRALRDPRYPVFEWEAQPVAIDADQARELQERFDVRLVEIDPVAPVVDASPLAGALPVALHLPHCHLTTGRICLAASDGLPDHARFRPGAPCAMQCARGIDVHAVAGQERTVHYTRHGRTVYFENTGCRLSGAQAARIIWTPDDYCCPHPAMLRRSEDDTPPYAW